MADKRTVSLPSVRIREELEIALLRLANRDHRVLSDYIRVVLERHCFGHVGANGAEDSDDEFEIDASQRDARSRGPRSRGG